MIFWVHRGVKGQKIISVALLISGTIHHMIVIYGANVYNDNISRCFFQCWNFDFPVCQWAERAKKKMAQNVENFCLSHLIFQKPYIIWSSFMVHMYMQQDNISRHFFLFFFFFRILIFGIISGKKAKNGPKWQKKFVWYTCVKWQHHQQVLVYVSGTVDHVIEILIMISIGVFL